MESIPRKFCQSVDIVTLNIYIYCSNSVRQVSNILTPLSPENVSESGKGEGAYENRRKYLLQTYRSLHTSM